MSEMENIRQARLFDALLSEAEQWRTAPSVQARRAAESDAAVAADLALVATLRETRPSRDETEFARVRVAQQLADLMRAEPAPELALVSELEPGEPSHLSPRPQGARAWMERKRVGAALRRLAPLVAALLLVAVAALAGASAASARALPESPFYVVKRAEETALLALSWSDDSKGQTLTMIANRRLDEATEEANQQHTGEARALLREFDTTFAQLIDLTAGAKVRHENTSALARAIQTTLAAEQTAATQAIARHETAFAQAASASAQAAAAHIVSTGVGAPPSPNQGAGQRANPGNGANNGASNGQGASSGASNGHGNGNGSGQGKPQETPGAQATHTPQPSHGNGNGNGQGNGKKSDPTPTPGATSTATPTPNG